MRNKNKRKRAAYMNNEEQRDDITIFAFKVK